MAIKGEETTNSKKIVALLIHLVLIFAFSTPLTAQSYTTDQRSKAIHVVYDDSGSMIYDYGVYVDRWGQAKYAMEVFAAMLEEKDAMRVYYMSDFDTSIGGSINAPAKITILGAEPPGIRVSKIHNTVTFAANTPYDAVAKAYADLKNQNTDEKWLVVLTDGEFNRLNGQSVANVDVDSFFSQYVTESDVKIILLAMGEDAEVIRANPNRGIFFEHAKTNNEILGKITSICNRIFNRNRLNFTNETRREFTFDIPMLELLVFAQGPDVKINGIKGGGTYSPSETVNVRYSDVAAVNFRGDPNVIISRNLTGVIATFRDIPKGSYSLDIAGEQTAEIYYKPVVNVVVKLFKGRREVSPQDIPEGKYQVRFGIVDESGNFFESSLLGNVEYEATVRNGGQSVPIKSGDTVSLQRGELEVNVLSHFLEINTAKNTVTSRVIEPLPLRERICNWIKKYPFIFWPLLILLLGLLLYLIFWRPKKRFPKYMKGVKPKITITNELGTRIDSNSGYFRIRKSTVWLPLCPETGTIRAAADGKPLPILEVRAIGNDYMELTNASKFSTEKLNGVEFRIGGNPLTEPPPQTKAMSCWASIESVYYENGIATMHSCSFARRTGRRR